MRCDGAGPDSASPQPVMARASSLRTAISQRDRSTDVTSGRGAPASAMMIAPAAFHDPVAARPGRSGGLPGPLRRERGEWTSRVDAIRGVNDDSDPPDVRRRGQGQYLGACARWRGRRSRCSSAPPSHCAWPPGPPVQAVHCHTRAGRSAILARWRLRFAKQALSALCG